MRRMELPQLKWLTFVVAACGVLALYALLVAAGPSGSAVGRVLRLALPVLGVFMVNEYAFRLVALREAHLERERRRLSALHRIGALVALVPGLEQNLGESLETLRRVMEADLVAWLEAAGDTLLCRAAVTGGGAQQGEAEGGCGDGEPWPAARRRPMWVVEDARAVAPEEAAGFPLLEARGLRAGVLIEAGVEERTLGAMVVGWRQAHRLSPADREFLENASHLLAVAAENMRLYRETQRVGALEERARIAREMHDGLAQALTYLKLKAETALAQTRPGTAPVLEAAMQTIRQGATDALEEVRRSLMDLRAEPVGSVGSAAADLGSALVQQVRSWSQFSDIRGEVQLPPEPVVLPAEMRAQVLRIVQEALANVRKHAQAQHAWVRVQRDGGELRIEVADDGRGFDPQRPAAPGHYGLGILHDRARTVGGALQIRSRPGRGTQVVLRVPLPEAAADAELLTPAGQAR